MKIDKIDIGTGLVDREGNEWAIVRVYSGNIINAMKIQADEVCRRSLGYILESSINSIINKEITSKGIKEG